MYIRTQQWSKVCLLVYLLFFSLSEALSGAHRLSYFTSEKQGVHAVAKYSEYVTAHHALNHLAVITGLDLYGRSRDLG